MKSLDELLEQSSALHRHLCPRQVLGMCIGILAGHVLSLDLPQNDKRLLAIVETDGCASDGVAVATNCWVGRRTMRIEDYGKVAATFVDTQTGQAVRIVPRLNIRQRASEYAPEGRNKWEKQLLGYQRMPALELLCIQAVGLTTPVEQIVSQPGRKALCDICGEEIMNEREILRSGMTFCRACVGPAYYALSLDANLTLPVHSLEASYAD
jgi:formylmethanofuran dehydrogenase subunit E